MTSKRNSLRRYGLAAASTLLLGSACSSPPAGENPAEAKTGTKQQAASTVRLCGKRHEEKDETKICVSSTDVASLYTRIVNDRIRSVCIIMTPTSWSSCMEWPPVLWPEFTSVENSAAWVEQAQRISAFYQSPGSTADVTMRSYELSLARIREGAWEMKDAHQSEIQELAARNTYILNTELGEKLKARAVLEGKEVQAQTAATREELSKIGDLVSAYQAKLQAMQPEYATVVSQFATYRENEDAVLAQLQALAQSASTATLQTLPEVQLQLVQLSRTESLAPQQMALDARALALKMGSVHDTFVAELEPYAAFMQTQGMVRPNLADTSIQVLEGVVTYADARYARTSAIVEKVMAGIRRRHEALVAQAAADDARATLTNASTLEASQKFLAEMNARVTQVGKLPPKSTRLSLYYLAEKLLEHEGILQMQNVCANVVSTPWMGTGCNSLVPQYSKSRTYVTSTIPSIIRLNVGKMRTAGVSETLLQEVEGHLAANRLRAATIAYDTAVRASELL